MNRNVAYYDTALLVHDRVDLAHAGGLPPPPAAARPGRSAAAAAGVAGVAAVGFSSPSRPKCQRATAPSRRPHPQRTLSTRPWPTQLRHSARSFAPAVRARSRLRGGVWRSRRACRASRRPAAPCHRAVRPASPPARGSARGRGEYGGGSSRRGPLGLLWGRRPSRGGRAGSTNCGAPSPSNQCARAGASDRSERLRRESRGRGRRPLVRVLCGRVSANSSCAAVGIRRYADTIAAGLKCAEASAESPARRDRLLCHFFGPTNPDP